MKKSLLNIIPLSKAVVAGIFIMLCTGLISVRSQTCTSNFTFLDSGLTVQFSDLSTGASIWGWDFGDGQISNQASPIHSYSVSGTYVVCLNVSDGMFCFDTFCDTVTVTGTANCLANFVFAADTANSMTINFTDSSSGSFSNWSWDFGDMSSSFQQDPSHTFSFAGTYYVCLTISDSAFTCNNTFCDFVSVTGGGSNCSAQFWYLTDSSNSLQLDFKDVSTNATGWLWNFGDSVTSNQQNPSHIYSSAGNYDVCLYITDSVNNCTDSICQAVVAGNSGNCQATFSYMPDTANALMIYFSDWSFGTITEWYWDFGDSAVSTLQNPVHTYSAPGNYQVCLNVSDSVTNCNNLFCQTINLSACYANFTYSNTNLTVDFTDASFGSPSSWYWDFGDSAASTLQNPSHTYSAAGYYQACMTISDSATGCYNTSCNYILVQGQTCEAGFTYNVYIDPFFGTLWSQFTDTSTGNPTIWYWDFGDGQFSTSQNPVPHQYDSAGIYFICLTISDSSFFCNDIFCDSIFIGVCENPCVSDFSVAVNNSTATFTNLSTGDCGTNQWTFGDGNIDFINASPVHYYDSAGMYMVCLTVSDFFPGVCASDSACKMVTIPPSTGTCSANFSYSVTGYTVNFTNLSTGNNLSYQWDFGVLFNSGDTSTQQNPSYTYTLPLTYTVCLIIDDGAGCYDQYCTSVEVFGADTSCTADFSFGTSGLTASFANMSTSTNPPTYLWDYGDGNTSTVDSVFSSYTYASSGSYQVCLTIYDGLANCNDTYCDSVTVCKAMFTYTDSALTVNFTNTSPASNPTTYFWSFGDGQNSNLTNPVHTYASSGTYNVCLAATDQITGCVNSYCEFVTVTNIGISEFGNHSSEIKVLPNPFHEFAILKISGKALSQNSILTVYDVFGRKVEEQPVSGRNGYTIVMRNGMENGIYFFEIINMNNVLGKGKFVIE